MANIALDRNMPSVAAGYRGVERTALQARGDEAQTGTVGTSAMTAITAYIPTEILTIYIAGVGIFSIESGKVAAWVFFIACVIATPAINFAVFEAKRRAAKLPRPTSAQGWPIWESTAATIAFVFYAAAIKQGSFSDAEWYSVEMAGFLVIIVTAALGLGSSFFGPGPTSDIAMGQPSTTPATPLSSGTPPPPPEEGGAHG